MKKPQTSIARFHLPGLFEFYDLYQVFLPLFFEHREFFYEWVEIASLYGAPADCIWGGGRVGFGEDDVKDVLALVEEYGISARLTFSNSLLEERHLSDKKCNELCELLTQHTNTKNGVIIHSEILLEYIKTKYPDLYLISSTTKVLTRWEDFSNEVRRPEFEYVVPDFRLNKDFVHLKALSEIEKDKVEFLCNECCYFGCNQRRACYEAVSRKILDENCEEHICLAPGAKEGYKFSKVMKNPGFIGIDDIKDTYLPMGFTNFKIEGRSLGSALILEFLLHYLVKPEHQLEVRESVYLDSCLDLF